MGGEGVKGAPDGPQHDVSGVAPSLPGDGIAGRRLI